MVLNRKFTLVFVAIIYLLSSCKNDCIENGELIKAEIVN
jgi:hypothetical protein